VPTGERFLLSRPESAVDREINPVAHLCLTARPESGSNGTVLNDIVGRTHPPHESPRALVGGNDQLAVGCAKTERAGTGGLKCNLRRRIQPNDLALGIDAVDVAAVREESDVSFARDAFVTSFPSVEAARKSLASTYAIVPPS